MRYQEVIEYVSAVGGHGGKRRDLSLSGCPQAPPEDPGSPF